MNKRNIDRGAAIAALLITSTVVVFRGVLPYMAFRKELKNFFGKKNDDKKDKHK